MRFIANFSTQFAHISGWAIGMAAGSTWDFDKSFLARIRMDSGWMRVTRGGSGAKAPPRAARPKLTGWLASLDTSG